MIPDFREQSPFVGVRFPKLRRTISIAMASLLMTTLAPACGPSLAEVCQQIRRRADDASFGADRFSYPIESRDLTDGEQISLLKNASVLLRPELAQRIVPVNGTYKFYEEGDQRSRRVSIWMAALATEEYSGMRLDVYSSHYFGTGECSNYPPSTDLLSVAISTSGPVPKMERLYRALDGTQLYIPRENLLQVGNTLLMLGNPEAFRFEYKQKESIPGTPDYFYELKAYERDPLGRRDFTVFGNFNDAVLLVWAHYRGGIPLPEKQVPQALDFERRLAQSEAARLVHIRAARGAEMVRAINPASPV